MLNRPSYPSQAAHPDLQRRQACDSLLSRPEMLRHSAACPRFLADALEESNLPDWKEITSALLAEGVEDLEMAGLLTLEEIKTILQNHKLTATVGRVRKCHKELADAWQRKHLSQSKVECRPNTVLMRSVLRQDAAHVREALAMRMTAESVFSALMLTIAFQAILEPPELDICETRFRITTCLGMRRAYAASWGLCAGFFLCSCLVSLASMQIFLALGSQSHYVAVAAEAYLSKSNTFIGAPAL